MNTAHVWRATLDRLRQQISRAQYDTWLRGTQLEESADGILLLRVKTTFAKALLESRYLERIQTAIVEVAGEPHTLQIVVGGSGATTQQGERKSARREDRVIGQEYANTSLFDARDDADAETLACQEQPRAIQPEPPADTVRERAPVVPAAQSRNGRVLHAASRARFATRGGTTRPYSSGDRLTVRRDREDDRADDRADDGAGGMTREEPVAAAREQVAADPPRREPRIPAAGAYVPVAATNGPGDVGGRGGSVAMQIPQPRLNPRYTFSTFIVGSANQLAHAASLAVAEAPGQAYNPLFLYGGVGLGKTHLLHAIGHNALEANLTVLYVSSETFTNEIINAIRYRTTEDFRAKYRSADVLLVDDIQFIAGKESTEEEFFHTFNSLYESNKQIVMCSDRPPKAITALAERLRSRFEWGLIADIQPPELETRVAILRAKADMLQRQVPDDVISFLASRVHSNIRELEGSLNRLLAYSNLQGMPLTVDTAKAALASLATDGRQKRVSVDDVLQAVAEHYRVSIEDLQGKQRDKHIVVPRQVAMYLMRQETEASLLEIGQALGGRDHSTVLHGCDKINREVNENSALRKEVLAIRQQLLG